MAEVCRHSDPPIRNWLNLWTVPASSGLCHIRGRIYVGRTLLVAYIEVA